MAPAPPATQLERVRRTELLISNLLRGGVLLSVALVLLGGAIAVARNPGTLGSRTEFDILVRGQIPFPTTPGSVLRGVAALDGGAFVVLGLLVLIATPIVRVGVSVVAFMQLGDRTFAAITSVVLTLLLVALLLGRAGG